MHLAKLDHLEWLFQIFDDSFYENELIEVFACLFFVIGNVKLFLPRLFADLWTVDAKDGQFGFRHIGLIYRKNV